MANIKISDLSALTTATDSSVFPVVESATTKKITALNLKNYFSPASVIRAQRINGGSASDGTKWTFTTVSGSATATFVNNGTSVGLLSNSYIVVTLTGFTKFPSVRNWLDMNLQADGGLADAGYVSFQGFDMTPQNGMSGGVMSPGNPNVLTTFTPSTHKVYMLAQETTAQDWYFEFRQ